MSCLLVLLTKQGVVLSVEWNSTCRSIFYIVDNCGLPLRFGEVFRNPNNRLAGVKATFD